MSEKRNEERGGAEIKSLFHERFGEPKPGAPHGVFGIEARAEERARELKHQLIKEEIESYGRGYEGNTRVCPKCGRKTQRYKGDRERTVRFECGDFKIARAYYVCEKCQAPSYPLDEQLGLVAGKEQGRLREKLSLLGVLTPYHQAPQVSRIFFDTEGHANALRRLVLREAAKLEEAEVEATTLEVRDHDTVYLEIDGHMCPTREERRDATDHGYREAKIAMAFCDREIAAVSKDRKELLRPIFQGKIAPAEEFIADLQELYHRAHADRAKRVVAIADGAKWIWNSVEEVAPEAIQILDYAHAKSHLYDAAKILYGAASPLVKPWVKKQQALLFKNEVGQVIKNLQDHSERKPAVEEIVTYFENNHQRMRYGEYQEQGLLIGSGAIESAGKRISQGRLKGCGMRWNISDLNRVIALRCAFFDNSWTKYWSTQHQIAA